MCTDITQYMDLYHFASIKMWPPWWGWNPQPFICCTLGFLVVHHNCHWHSTSRARQKQLCLHCCIVLFVSSLMCSTIGLGFHCGNYTDCNTPFTCQTAADRLKAGHHVYLAPGTNAATWWKFYAALMIISLQQLVNIFIITKTAKIKGRQVDRPKEELAWSRHRKVQHKSDFAQCILVSFHEVW